ADEAEMNGDSYSHEIEQGQQVKRIEPGKPSHEETPITARLRNQAIGVAIHDEEAGNHHDHVEQRHQHAHALRGLEAAGGPVDQIVKGHHQHGRGNAPEPNTTKMQWHHSPPSNRPMFSIELPVFGGKRKLSLTRSISA